MRLAVRLGQSFFRWRSYLPLLLIPFIVWAIAVSHEPFGSAVVGRLWELGCVVFALGGLALRVYTVGTAGPGTSGRNTRRQKARSLNTTGAYSVVRHPLYLGNFLIVVGLSLFPHAWVVPLIVAVVTIAYYGCIAHAEEAYLEERFGAEFRRWAARVPAMIPSFSSFAPPARRFDWMAATRREFYALAVILVTPMFLDMTEDFYSTGHLLLDPLWTGVASAGALVFVILRTLKKRGLLSQTRSEERFRSA